jgi:hypothetical protein
MGRPAYGLGSKIDRAGEYPSVNAPVNSGTGTADVGTDGRKTKYLVHNGIKWN